MLSISLMGGIGNLLFQVATMEALSNRYAMPLYYADIDKFFDDLSRQTAWTTHAKEYLTIFENLDWHKNQDIAVPPSRVIKIPFRYVRLFPEENTRYIGYFQSERFFEDQGDYVRWLCRPALHVRELMSKYDGLFDVNTCSIHVRRGNYVELAHIHTPQDIDYYNRAMEYLSPYGIERFLVFSDDIAWCKENFIGEKFVFIEDIDYVCLFLQAKCTHHIIANSSFSWWGSYLSTNPSNRTVAPAKWFANGTDDTDIVTWRWTKL